MKDWFAKYDFEVQHIKGDSNLIPDMLSRPPRSSTIQLISHTASFPVIMSASSSHPPPSPQKGFPPGLSQTSTLSQIRHFALAHLFYYLSRILETRPSTQAENIFNPSVPFFVPYKILPDQFNENDLWYLWCAVTLYSMPVSFHTVDLYHFLYSKNAPSTFLWMFLNWFEPITWWKKELQQIMTRYEFRMINQDTLLTMFIMNRPYFCHPKTNLLWTQNLAYEWFTVSGYPQRSHRMALAAHLAEINDYRPPPNDVETTFLGQPPDHMVHTPAVYTQAQPDPDDNPDPDDDPQQYWEDSQDPNEDLPEDQPEHQGPWYKSLLGYSPDSDERRNLNLSPSPPE